MKPSLSPPRGWNRYRRRHTDDEEDKDEDDVDDRNSSVDENDTDDSADSDYYTTDTEDAEGGDSIDEPTGDFDFSDFFFREGTKLSYTTQDVMRAQRILYERLGVVTFTMSPPFIILESWPTMPPEAQRPFLIGGLIAICRDQSNMDFDRWPMSLADSWGGTFVPKGQFPRYGHRRDELAEMDPDVLATLRHGEIPPDSSMEHIATHKFPDCEALTWKECPLELIVELPRMPDAEYRKHLETLPSAFYEADFLLRYHNGPLPSGKRQPKLKLYPGSWIHPTENNHGQTYCPASAGVFIRKGRERRVTCSYHKWDDKVKEHPRLLGKDSEEAKRVFRIGHDTRPVAYLKERIRSTDIGLAKLDEDEVVFENRFQNIDAVAQRFLHSSEINLWDEFLISSFANGKQHKLVSMGMRFVIKRKAGTMSCITAKQIVCAGNDPVLTSRSRTGHVACGAVLVKCRDGKNRKISKKTVLERGEVCAMFPYADLQANDTPGRHIQDYFVFADMFDPLIEDKWSIVPCPAVGSEPAHEVNTYDEDMDLGGAAVEEIEDEIERAPQPSIQLKRWDSFAQEGHDGAE